ncbi:MAG: hypothetical protein MSS99_01500, partial [Bacteroidales bacterium]|nr:hypothetical protein [Bacteroidales bacterium]
RHFQLFRHFGYGIEQLVLHVCKGNHYFWLKKNPKEIILHLSSSAAFVPRFPSLKETQNQLGVLVG